MKGQGRNRELRGIKETGTQGKLTGVWGQMRQGLKDQGPEGKEQRDMRERETKGHWQNKDRRTKEKQETES